MLTRLDRITERADREPTGTFHNLYSLPNEDLRWLAFRKLKRDKAPGYAIDDNWPSLVKHREATRRMALRWIRRRSQQAWMSWAAYAEYLQRHPLAEPSRIVDLIAMARGAR